MKLASERTRLSGEFAKIFMKIADERDLKKKIIVTPSKITNPIIADGKILNADKMGEIEHGGIREIQLNLNELQQRFDTFISQNCTPYFIFSCMCAGAKIP